MSKRLHQLFVAGLMLLCFASCDDDPVGPAGKDLITGEIMMRSNPWAPLTVDLQLTTSEPTTVSVRVIGKNGMRSDIGHSYTKSGTAHDFLVLGLYPDHSNQIEVTVTTLDGVYTDQDVVEVSTDLLPDYFPQIVVEQSSPEQMDGQLTLISHLSKFEPNVPFLIDAFGDVRWYLDYHEHPVLENMFYDVGVERLQNGNLYFGTANVNQIMEVDMTGEIVNAWDMPGHGFHHNVQEKPDGNFLVTTNKWGSMHANGNYTVEDHIIEIDRDRNEIVNEWDLRESLNEWRTDLINNLNSPYIDWIHLNAVVYDPSDNTIIASGRTQGVVKLDYDNKVKWILGAHRGWGTNGRGEDLKEYLLQPLDADGQFITNPDVIDGSQSHPDFDWNWYQHAHMLHENGNLMLFDNGDRRNWGNGAEFSRAVEYIIDQEAMTVQQIWEFGRNYPHSYSPIISDVDHLEDSDHILYSPGHIVNGPSGEIEGRIIEVDYSTGEVFYDVRIICLPNRGLTFHRAERMTLYPG